MYAVISSVFILSCLSAKEFCTVALQNRLTTVKAKRTTMKKQTSFLSRSLSKYFLSSHLDYNLNDYL